jgi:hypothetical protein
MDKVTQQNAANAEESASASEELSAQAVSMKEIVGQLVAMVGGAGTQDTRAMGSQIGRQLSQNVEHRLRTPTFGKSDEVLHAISRYPSKAHRESVHKAGSHPAKDSDMADFNN